MSIEDRIFYTDWEIDKMREVLVYFNEKIEASEDLEEIDKLNGIVRDQAWFRSFNSNSNCFNHDSETNSNISTLSFFRSSLIPIVSSTYLYLEDSLSYCNGIAKLLDFYNS